MKNLIEKIKEAKKQIIAYQTLPPQIDYTLPFKIKAKEAEEFINSLPERIKKSIFSQIEKEIDHYYSEDGGAQYDDLF